MLRRGKRKNSMNFSIKLITERTYCSDQYYKQEKSYLPRDKKTDINIDDRFCSVKYNGVLQKMAILYKMKLRHHKNISNVQENEFDYNFII